MTIPDLETLRALGPAQQPAYDDAAAVERAVARLRTMPPLVFAGECDDLKDKIAAVAPSPLWFQLYPRQTKAENLDQIERGKSLPDGFRYASDNNDDWLTNEQLLEMTDHSQVHQR